MCIYLRHHAICVESLKSKLVAQETMKKITTSKNIYKYHIMNSNDYKLAIRSILLGVCFLPGIQHVNKHISIK